MLSGRAGDPQKNSLTYFNISNVKINVDHRLIQILLKQVEKKNLFQLKKTKKTKQTNVRHLFLFADFITKP